MSRIDPLDWVRRWLGAVLLPHVAIAALLGSAGAASAHASLIRVDPADGAVVATAPRSFSLTFNEPTAPLVLKLVRPDGSAIPLDRFVLRDATLEIEAPADLAGGTYVLSWRVISEDGHPVGGSAVFSIGAPSAGGAPIATEAIDWPVRIAIWAVRIAVYAGLFLGVGGVFFLRWIGGPRPISSPLRAILLLGVAASALSIGLQGLDALDLPLSALSQPSVWTTGWSTSYGVTAAIAGASILIAFSALRYDFSIGKILSALALLGVGAALAASGHASAARPQWVTRPAVFLHGVGIAFWAGSLAPLGAALTSRTPEAAAILRHFSRAIPFAVLPLIAAGVLLAVTQLRSLEALWTTAYGRVLTVKLLLLALLFGFAVVNRFRLTERSERGDARAVHRLGASIRLEIILVLTIFVVAAAWRFTPPPRALAEAAAAPASVHIHGAKAMAELEIAPGRAGPSTASIAILNGDFGPLEAQDVTLVIANPAAAIEPIRRPAQRAPDGTWTIDDLNLPLPGRWSVRIDILISDFELAKLEGEIEIGP